MKAAYDIIESGIEARGFGDAELDGYFRLLEGSGEHRRAVRFFKKAMDAGDDSFHAAALLALAYELLGNVDAAVSIADSLVLANPGRSDPILLKAGILSRGGRADDATRSLDLL